MGLFTLVWTSFLGWATATRSSELSFTEGTVLWCSGDTTNKELSSVRDWQDCDLDGKTDVDDKNLKSLLK